MICDFCFRHCDIREGQTGWCRSRVNEGGRIRDTDYSGLAALADDPVEKKPLYHFLPFSRTLSVAMEGCSFDCDFCQNHEIAKDHHGNLRSFAPEFIVETAERNGFPSISFTYTEPLVWQDYMIDTARHAEERGIRSVMVSNGVFSDEAIERILPVIDAYNIDLKGDEAFYRNICHGSLEPVLNGIERIVRHGSHLEVTTLIIEGIHDEGMIRKLGKMLYERGVSVWHLTRFYPMRRMADRMPTSQGYLKIMAEAAAGSGIPHIYSDDDRVICPECGESVSRRGFSGICPSCGERVYGIWS